MIEENGGGRKVGGREGTLGGSNVSSGRKMSTPGKVSYKSHRGVRKELRVDLTRGMVFLRGPAGTKKPLPTMLSLQWPNTAFCPAVQTPGEIKRK